MEKPGHTYSPGLAYYFDRSAFRIIDFLHLNSSAPVSVAAAARNSQPWKQFGEEITLLISVGGLTAVVLLILRLRVGARVGRVILNSIACMSALLAAPALYLYVLERTWNLSEFPADSNPYSFWQSPSLIIFAAEVVCIAALLFIYKTKPLPTWMIGFLLFVHYGFWCTVLWPNIWMFGQRLFAIYLLLLTFPLAAGTWLVYFTMPTANGSTADTDLNFGKRILTAALLGITMLVLLWLPSRRTNLTHPRDLNSLKVELSRGPCYGPCPSYTVTIHGSGMVEYVGERDVKVHGSQAGSVTAEQLQQILETLDRARFSGLEDRAFDWGFDTPSVSVSIAVDGATKRVVSDAVFVGAPSGPQAKFVKAADEIDMIVGSDRWVKCDGHCAR